jgi:hypothetical protein
MVKRGLSKSMKKRISELMKKKKLSVKDKKFLAKIQKGGADTWGQWFSGLFYLKTPTTTPTPASTESQLGTSGDGDHTAINKNIASLEQKVCKVCLKVGADCNCPGETGETGSELPTPMEREEGEGGENSTSKNSEGNPTSQQQLGVPSRMGGGRKSRKNKRRGSKKSAKKMSCLW